MMKHSTLFIGCLVAGSSMATPLPIRISEPKEERLSRHHNILPRALRKTPTGLFKPNLPQSNSRRIAPLGVSTRAKPAARPLKNSATSNGAAGNGPSSNGARDNGARDNGSGGNGSRGNGSNGHGQITDGKIYPPAEATARVRGRGHLVINNHPTDDAMYSNAYRAEDHPQGKVIQGHVSASALAGSMDDGGKVTAKGYHKVSAIIYNEQETKGCIECKIPGQKPIHVEANRGGPIKMTVENVNPALGPLEIKAEQDGPGFTTATAKNP